MSNDATNGPYDEYEKDRHPSTIHMLTMLKPNPNLPEGLARQTSEMFFAIALDACDSIKDGPELTAGLRKVLEAKDCLIRAGLDLTPVVYYDL